MTRDIAAEVAAFLRPREPTSDAWDIVVEEVGEGYARIRMAMRADMLNGHGSGHGGVVFAFADTAFGYACNSRNVRTVGAHASIVYLRPAAEGETLIAEAFERALCGRSGLYDVSVRTAAGAVIAEFRGYSRSVGGAVIEDGTA